MQTKKHVEQHKHYGHIVPAHMCTNRDNCGSSHTCLGPVAGLFSLQLEPDSDTDVPFQNEVTSRPAGDTGSPRGGGRSVSGHTSQPLTGLQSLLFLGI